jgi:hypothetical protein
MEIAMSALAFAIGVAVAVVGVHATCYAIERMRLARAVSLGLRSYDTWLLAAGSAALAAGTALAAWSATIIEEIAR